MNHEFDFGPDDFEGFFAANRKFAGKILAAVLLFWLLVIGAVITAAVIIFG